MMIAERWALVASIGLIRVRAVSREPVDSLSRMRHPFVPDRKGMPEEESRSRIETSQSVRLRRNAKTAVHSPDGSGSSEMTDARRSRDGGDCPQGRPAGIADGHLRADTAGNEEIPVLIIDVSDEEAATLFAMTWTRLPRWQVRMANCSPNCSPKQSNSAPRPKRCFARSVERGRGRRKIREGRRMPRRRGRAIESDDDWMDDGVHPKSEWNTAAMMRPTLAMDTSTIEPGRATGRERESERVQRRRHKAWGDGSTNERTPRAMSGNPTSCDVQPNATSRVGRQVDLPVSRDDSDWNADCRAVGCGRRRSRPSCSVAIS